MSYDPTDCPRCSGFHPGVSCEQGADNGANEPYGQDEEQCQAEFIDGSWYGDDCPQCRESVESEAAECEQCQEEDYCSRHMNGVFG